MSILRKLINSQEISKYYCLQIYEKNSQIITDVYILSHYASCAVSNTQGNKDEYVKSSTKEKPGRTQSAKYLWDFIFHFIDDSFILFYF